jgi:COP9 signalosome complex subunit 3
MEVYVAVVFETQDNNLGLAKQALASLYKRNIQRLTQTYLTLSLQDIADTVRLNGPKEAELHILQMVGAPLTVYRHQSPVESFCWNCSNLFL